MRLKDILKESSVEEKMEEVSKLLGSEFRDDLPKLYRATDRYFDGAYTIREIRKGRKPIGASTAAQLFLDFMAQREYSDIPMRANSKFATTVISGSGFDLDVFGDHIFLVFPEVNANIVSFDKDTKGVRDSLDVAFSTIRRGLRQKFDPEDMDYPGNPYYLGKEDEKYDKIDSFFELTALSSESKVWDFLENNWEELKRELKRAKSENPHIADSINQLLYPAYFRLMDKDIKEGDQEVIFDGERYLYVKRRFFNEYFEWSRSKWELKNEV